MSLQQKNHLHISIFFRAPLFTVEAGIGTPPMKARLVFDTAALLTWTQCQPCIHCFKQDYPVFDLRKSTSYKRLYRNHTLSPNFNCTILECYYYVASHGGLSSQGLVSVHTFSFPGSEEQLKNIAFGCGTHNYGKNFGPAMMFTGVLGMGNSPTSLSHQLGKRGMHRFSYCLPSLRSSKTKKGHITFGGTEVMVNAKNVQTARLLIRRGTYGVNLVGISVAGKRLEIPTDWFDGGCTIDSSTPFSIIEERAYKALVSAISSYFSQYQNIKQMVSKKYPKNLCYKYPRGFRKFPSMILHFEGAELEINGSSLFMFGRNLFLSNYVCLQILGEAKTNILGVHQQQNVRFLFDLGMNKVSFANRIVKFKKTFI